MRSRISFGICTLLLTGWMPVIGCGGSGKSTSPAPATYTISGTVSGAAASGLVLQNNGGSNLTLNANATSFAFATPVQSGGVYSVTVLTQPAGETCTVTNGSGTATANVSNVGVTCVPLFTIGGSISGLKGPGLVLQDNGGDNLAVSSSASSFTFPTPLASGSAYKITVLSQPAGQNCVVTNGTSTATANVTTANIVCTQLYAIGGTVTGLHGKGLVLQDNGGDNLPVNADATSFVFASPLAAGSKYSIAVLTQPAGENCSVTDGSGTVSTDVLNAGIVCVGEWAWMGGSSSLGLNLGQAGVYGSLGTSSPTNLPGGRTQSAIWKDASGNTWLFGGYGYDSNGTGGQLNDLWKFDPTKGTSGEWTWMGGSTTHIYLGQTFPNGRPGVYGTLGKAAPANVPGGREQAVSWIDASGNLWIFGGIGIDSVGMYAYLNDLWEFNPNLGSNGEWTWMGGSSVAPPADPLKGQPYGRNGVYGTLGSAASANVPGGRYGAYAWTDASGSLWLYGGNGFDAAGHNSVYLNDLWKYTPHSDGTPGEWAWMSGSSSVPPGPAPWILGAEPGVYGTLGTPDAANVPGGHSSGVAWADTSGNFWLFGGLGADSAGTTGYLNDLWRYTPGTSGEAGEWTWMGGNETIGGNGGQPGVYGVLGQPTSDNAPGARFSPASWTDASGNFWMFGGQGYDWIGSSGFLNDLWKYTPDADGGMGQWTWMGGSNIIPISSASQSFGLQSGEPGVYGTLGVPAAANTPGARIGAVPWVDASGNIWLFGGQGYDANGAQGYLNDSWNYQP
jgi:N-acetylneuraminic acid mutarotase